MKKYYDCGWNEFVNGKPFDTTQKGNKDYADGYEDAKSVDAKEELE